MSEISDRLVAVQKFLKINQSVMAKRLGVSQSYTSQVLRGEGKPSLEMVIGIAMEFPEIDLRWLLTSKGTMIRPTMTADEVSLLDAYQALDEPGKAALLVLARTIASKRGL